VAGDLRALDDLSTECTNGDGCMGCLSDESNTPSLEKGLSKLWLLVAMAIWTLPCTRFNTAACGLSSSFVGCVSPATSTELLRACASTIESVLHRIAVATKGDAWFDFISSTLAEGSIMQLVFAVIVAVIAEASPTDGASEGDSWRGMVSSAFSPSELISKFSILLLEIGEIDIILDPGLELD